MLEKTTNSIDYAGLSEAVTANWWNGAYFCGYGRDAALSPVIQPYAQLSSGFLLQSTSRILHGTDNGNKVISRISFLGLSVE